MTRPQAATHRSVWKHLGVASAFAFLSLLLAGTPLQASEGKAAAGGLQLSGSGFYTLAAAKAVRVRVEDKSEGLRCRCFVAEYSQGGVHEDGRIGFEADSKLGLQGRVANGDGRWSATAQILMRGARGGRVNLEWLYATYEINGNWTAQFGRKRLPLLSFSEVQDVSVAYPWVRLPPQMYGWDIVNYNGANLLWRGTFGEFAVMANAFAGTENLKDSPSEALYYSDGSRTDTRWSGIRGIEVELRRGDLKLRASALRAQSSYVFTAPGDVPTFYPGGHLRIASAAAAFEPGPWTFLAETFYGDRRTEYGIDRSWSVAAGRRFGRAQLLWTHSSYRQVINELVSMGQGDDMSSVVLRWDAAPGRVWKLQFDDLRDRSTGDFSIGSRRLLSISYSGTF
jgi:hypothetical protein